MKRLVVGTFARGMTGYTKGSARTWSGWRTRSGAMTASGALIVDSSQPVGTFATGQDRWTR